LHFILKTPRQWPWHRALLNTIDYVLIVGPVHMLEATAYKALHQGLARSAFLRIMRSMCRWMPSAPLLDFSSGNIGRESCVVT
jgi:hypothetical protein